METFLLLFYVLFGDVAQLVAHAYGIAMTIAVAVAIGNAYAVGQAVCVAALAGVWFGVGLAVGLHVCACVV